jgi:Tfp pilus assembly protein PilX
MKTSNRGKNNKKGIALLFSVMLSAIFLTIALGVLNISVKELNFSTSGKDTNNAFFAADSGVECALYNDKSGSTTFTGTDSTIDCFGTSYPLSPTFDFNINIGLGSNGNSCAKVNVSKTFDGNDIVTATTITSKGYNIGDSNCTSSNTNRVERVLEVNY